MTARPTLPLLLLSLAACSSAETGLDTNTTSDTNATAAPVTTDMSESTGLPDPTGNEGTGSGQPTTGDASASEASTSDANTSAATSDASTTATTGPVDEPPLPLDGPCQLGPAAPGRLAVITNDFIEPASLHVVDVATKKLSADVAAVPSDPALAWGAGKLVIIGRYGFNTLDVLDGKSYAPLAKLDVQIDGQLDVNPQALAFAPDGRAYLSALASAILPIYDLDKPPAEALVDSVDLGEFADRDGSPEPGISFTCGGTLLVGIQRLVNFVPVDISSLVAVDLASGAVIDLDPETDGNQSLPLLGPWPKQVRLDPTDPAGQTVLVLTSGIERVDLVHASSTWAVSPEQLAGVGIEGFDLQAFEVAADGASAYVLATDGDYPASAVFHVVLDGVAAPTPMINGLTTRERAIERIGDHLWVGDAEPKNPRLRVFDLSLEPAVEQAPIVTNGAPYLFLPIP